MISVFKNLGKDAEKVLVPLDVTNKLLYPSLAKLNIAPLLHTKELSTGLKQKVLLNKLLVKPILDTKIEPSNNNGQNTVFQTLSEFLSPPGVILPPFPLHGNLNNNNNIHIGKNLSNDNKIARIPGKTPPNYPQGNKLPHLWEFHKAICVRFIIKGKLIYIPVGHLTSRNVAESIFISTLSYDRPIPLYIRPYKLNDPQNLVLLTEQDILLSERASARFEELYDEKNDNLLILTHDSYENVATLISDLLQ